MTVALYDGKKHTEYHFDSNDEKAGKEIIKLLGNDTGESLVTMEASGVYHLRLAVLLYSKGIKISVVNPLVIKRYAQMKMVRAKTDRVDARIIAEYGYTQEPFMFMPKSDTLKRVTLYLKGIDDLLKTKNQITNRLEALSRQSCKCEDLNKSFKKLVEQINHEIKQLEEKIKSLVKQEYEETYNRLKEIEGVGERVSICIIGHFGNFENFESPKQVASYIGINPAPYESGTSVKRRGHISKKGSPYIRTMLFLASLSASIYNLQCKELYERLINNGKPKKVALIAVANKLIRQIFVIVKYGRQYDPQYKL